MFKFFSEIDNRNFIFFLLLLAITANIFAYSAEYFFDVKPCVLCIYQRYIYFLVIIVTGFYFLNKKKSLSPIILYVCLLLFITQLITSLYNVGVERKIFEGLHSCQASLTKYDNLSELAEQIKSPSNQFAPCNQVALKIFGFSLAEINSLCSIIIIFSLIIKIIHNRKITYYE